MLLAGGQERAVAPERFEYTEIHMAMPVRLVMYAPDSTRARAAARAAFGRIALLEATMSDYRAQSELTRLQGIWGARVPVSADLYAIMARSVEMAALTNGAFDPTAGTLVALWRKARHTGVVPSANALDSARARTGWRHVELDIATRSVKATRSIRFDLGAIAKGFILGEAAIVLRRHGIGCMMIEAGGDIVVGDAPPGAPGWKIEVPGASVELARHTTSLVNVALATSGPSRQFVVIDNVRYSHVVDPRTGWALRTSSTAWVIARDAATADALATALTVMNDAERALMRSRFPGVIFEVGPVR